MITREGLSAEDMTQAESAGYTIVAEGQQQNHQYTTKSAIKKLYNVAVASSVMDFQLLSCQNK